MAGLNTLFKFLFLWLFSNLATADTDTEQSQFRSYVADFEAHSTSIPLSIEAQRSVKVQADGTALIINQAKAMMTNIHEQSHISDSSCTAHPLHYEYSRKVLGRKQQYAQQFDWPKSEWQYLAKDHPNTPRSLEPDTTDRLMVQFKVRCAIQSGQTQFSFPVASKDHIKQHTYQVIGEEDIELPYGKLAAVHVQRVRTDSKRKTDIWIAKELDYAIVKIVQKKEDDVHTLALRSFEFLD